MAKEVTNDKKEDVTAQGAANASTPSAEAPDWLQLLFDSNAAVIESNAKVVDISTEVFQSNAKNIEEVSKSKLELLESNQSVLASSQEVLAAIEAFNQNASTVVKEIMDEAKGSGGTPQQFDVEALTSSFKNAVLEAIASNRKGAEIEKQVEKPAVKINKKAKYVVAKGQKFFSTVSETMVEEGSEVTGLEPERLASLISQGIAVVDSEED